MRLTHLQRRRLIQLEQLSRSVFRHATQWLTSRWNSSRAANEKLCALGLAERYGQTFWSDSGKPQYVGDVRITPAGISWLQEAGEIPSPTHPADVARAAVEGEGA